MLNCSQSLGKFFWGTLKSVKAMYGSHVSKFPYSLLHNSCRAWECSPAAPPSPALSPGDKIHPRNCINRTKNAYKIIQIIKKFWPVPIPVWYGFFIPL